MDESWTAIMSGKFIKICFWKFSPDYLKRSNFALVVQRFES